MKKEPSIQYICANLSDLHKELQYTIAIALIVLINMYSTDETDNGYRTAGLKTFD